MRGWVTRYSFSKRPHRCPKIVTFHFIQKIRCFYISSFRVRHWTWSGFRCDEALYLKVCELQGCRPTTPDAPSQGQMKWNVENEIWGRGKREKPEKNVARLRFVHHETQMEWPRRELWTTAVGDERVTAYATEPPHVFTQNVPLAARPVDFVCSERCIPNLPRILFFLLLILH